MPSADTYAPYSMTSSVAANVISKAQHYCHTYPEDDKRDELKLIVYGENHPVPRQMWLSIFRNDLPNLCYSTEFPLIPIPPHYTPDRYKQYEEELRKYVTGFFANKNFIWALFNLAASGYEPRMHLVIANRYVKRSELGRWAHNTDTSNKSESDGRILGRLSSFIEPMASAFSGASLRDGGESDGTVSSSIRSSPDELFRDPSRMDISEEVIGPGSIEGSSDESSAGDRSSGGQPAPAWKVTEPISVGDSSPSNPYAI